MTVNRNTRVPNAIVYGVLYGVIYGISIWLLGFRNDSPTNWILYFGMGVAVLAGLSKLAVQSSQKKYQHPALAQRAR